MKKINKGHTAFTIGVIVYLVLGAASLIIGIYAIIESSSSYSYYSQGLASVGFSLLSIFAALSLWFISFCTAFRQRKTQIELLEQLVAQGMSDSI